ncbi:MAG: ferrous iron transport protein A [Candidatus Enteromonas sp.]
MKLLVAKLHQTVNVIGFEDMEPSTLSHLQALGIYPGGELVVLENALGGVVCKVKDSRLALDHDVADSILVEERL